MNKCEHNPMTRVNMNRHSMRIVNQCKTIASKDHMTRKMDNDGSY